MKPSGVEDNWVLRVRVEDVVAHHVPEDESVPDLPEEIEQEQFPLKQSR
jgi:hypothetical protein